MKRMKRIGSKSIIALISLLAITGCGSMDGPSNNPQTSINPSNKPLWFINRIRTPEGAIIKSDILSSWKNDLKYGNHLSPETYTLKFSSNGSVLFKNISGVSVPGNWHKKSGVLTINFENNKQFIGNSYKFEEYLDSNTLVLTDTATDWCYEFVGKCEYSELEYLAKKQEIYQFIDNNIKDVSYSLESINGLKADETHYYHDELFNAETYNLEFKTVDDEPHLLFKNKISESETKVAEFKMIYDAEYSEDGLVLSPKLSFIEEKSDLPYYSLVTIDLATKKIEGKKVIDKIYIDLGNTSFVFK